MYAQFRLHAMANIKELDITLDPKDPLVGIKDVVKAARPTWSEEGIKHKPVGGGLVNFLWKVSHSSHLGDDLLVRVFDPTKFFDHDAEWIILKELVASKAVAPVYVKYKNGYCYQFSHGSTLSPKDLTNPEVYKLVIASFHRFHQTKLDVIESALPNHRMILKLPAFINVFAGPASEALKTMEKYTSHFPSREDLAAEANHALNVVFKGLMEEFPMVLCHNDAHYTNIIHNKEQGTITFIDFDMVSVGPEVYDLGVHMDRDADFAFEDPENDVIGNEDFKKAFVTHYLETHPSYKGQDISQELIRKWLDGLNRSIYFSSLLGCIAMLLQCASPDPSIPYDYWQCSRFLLNKAKRSKAMFSSEPLKGCTK